MRPAARRSAARARIVLHFTRALLVQRPRRCALPAPHRDSGRRALLPSPASPPARALTPAAWRCG